MSMVWYLNKLVVASKISICYRVSPFGFLREMGVITFKPVTRSLCPLLPTSRYLRGSICQQNNHWRLRVLGKNREKVLFLQKEAIQALVSLCPYTISLLCRVLKKCQIFAMQRLRCQGQDISY